MLRLSRLFRSTPPGLIGVDITSCAIKFLELSRLGKQLSVEHYGIIPLSEDLMDGDVIQNVHGLADCLKHAFSVIKLLSNQVVLSIPDTCTIRKIIQVSADLSADDIEAFAQLEIEKYIPDGISAVNFDYKLMGSRQRGLNDLLIVASRAEHIDGRVNALRLAGFKTACVDIESYVMQRVLQYMLEAELMKAQPFIVLLIIHCKHINIFAFHDIKVIFTHQALYQEQAALLITIKRLLQFFYMAHPNHHLQEILLAGEITTELLSLLQEAVQLLVVVVNPFQHMLFAKQVNRDDFSLNAMRLVTACGLALRL